MKTENQVASFELSQRLKTLGVKQKSLFYWFHCTQDGKAIGWRVMHSAHDSTADKYAAFTVSELVEMLPHCIGNPHLEMCKYEDGRYGLEYLCSKWNTEGKTFADACAKMLIRLIEEGIVAPWQIKY